MAEYECICKYCAFADACPSAYFPANKMKCADLRDMRRNADNTRTPKEREVIIMTMYPFDHIRRNWDKRLALHDKASALLAEAEKQNELALDIEDDDEWEARNDEINNTIMKRFWEIRKTEFALCYPESRNKWFANFVSSFADGCTQISEKQYRIFERYCEENEESWRTFERYCRMGDRLITLKWKNSNRSVTIERFNTNVKELLA